MPAEVSSEVQSILQRGVVIPASPLALAPGRRLDERRQRVLWRYYSDAGAGGMAVGVHTTQFAIRDPHIGLYTPLLTLAADEFTRLDRHRPEPLLRVAGICGPTPQAVREAELARSLGYHAGLLSLGALRDSSDVELIQHCRAVAGAIPLFGFYLQPAVGGRVLDYAFWRELATVDNLVAIKIAPFHRYQTLDVVRAIAESGRNDVALYTGNDDNIIMDLLTAYAFRVNDRSVCRRMVGGLLGHWAVWTRSACELLEACHRVVGHVPPSVPGPSEQPAFHSGRPAAAAAWQADLRALLTTAAAVTDMNAAVFDAANNYAGCIPGIHEVLRRSGLLEHVACLDPRERLSPGQAAEIDRVCQQYPQLVDGEFVRQNLDRWLGD